MSSGYLCVLMSAGHLVDVCDELISRIIPVRNMQFPCSTSQNIGLEHCRGSYIEVKSDYYQSGAFQVLTSGRPLGHLWGKHHVLCATSGEPLEKIWIWSQNIENDSKANI